MRCFVNMHRVLLVFAIVCGPGSHFWDNGDNLCWTSPQFRIPGVLPEGKPIWFWNQFGRSGSCLDSMAPNVNSMPPSVGQPTYLATTHIYIYIYIYVWVVLWLLYVWCYYFYYIYIYIYIYIYLFLHIILVPSKV